MAENLQTIQFKMEWNNKKKQHKKHESTYSFFTTQRRRERETKKRANEMARSDLKEISRLQVKNAKLQKAQQCYVCAHHTLSSNWKVYS